MRGRTWKIHSFIEHSALGLRRHGRLVEEEEVAAALEEEGVLMCVHRVRKGGFRACYVRVRSRGLLRALLQNGHGFPVRRLRIIIPKVPAPRATATHLLRASLREGYRPGARLSGLPNKSQLAV